MNCECHDDYVTLEMHRIYIDFEDTEQRALHLNSATIKPNERIKVLANLLCNANELLILLHTHQRTCEMMDGTRIRKIRLIVDGIMIRFVLMWKYIYSADLKEGIVNDMGLVKEINDIIYNISELVNTIAKRDKDLMTPTILEAIKFAKKHVASFIEELKSGNGMHLEGSYKLNWPMHVSVSHDEENDCLRLIRQITERILEEKLGHIKSNIDIQFVGHSSMKINIWQ
jgi:hypothetical protein